MAQLAHAFYNQSPRLRNAGAAIYNTSSGWLHAGSLLQGWAHGLILKLNRTSETVIALREQI
jgi:hypothetical protein